MKMLSSAVFEKKIGYVFANKKLLEEALTHASAAKENAPNNQRLEFLGDRVLGLCVSEALINADTEANEGILAPRLNALVSRVALTKVAAELDIAAFMRVGASERRLLRSRRETIVADALEALIAAIYLDGGYQQAEKFILRFWSAHIDSVADDARDPKTILQEAVQSRGLELPHYEVVETLGPAHALSFIVRVHLETGASARGEGTSKRQAEQEAAQSLLDKLQFHD